MKNMTRSRSVSPVLNCLEHRCLLSRATVGHANSFHGDMSMPMPMGTSTEVSLMPAGVYEMGHLVAVDLMAMTSSSSGATPKGKVTFEMVMPAGTTMPGMHSGTTILGTKTLHNGMATLKVKPGMVLNMPLEISYKGSGHFDPSSVTPPEVTSSSLMNSSSSKMTM